MTDEVFRCPRRGEYYANSPFVMDQTEKQDAWQDRGGGRMACSYCGSNTPDYLFAKIETGISIGPTDKSYKIYIGENLEKFYFQHLSRDQMQKFIDLLNAKKITIQYPGYFYVRPFFIAPTGP